MLNCLRTTLVLTSFLLFSTASPANKHPNFGLFCKKNAAKGVVTAATVAAALIVYDYFVLYPKWYHAHYDELAREDNPPGISNYCKNYLARLKTSHIAKFVLCGTASTAFLTAVFAVHLNKQCATCKLSPFVPLLAPNVFPEVDLPIPADNLPLVEDVLPGFLVEPELLRELPYVSPAEPELPVINPLPEESAPSTNLFLHHLPTIPAATMLPEEVALPVAEEQGTQMYTAIPLPEGEAEDFVCHDDVTQKTITQQEMSAAAAQTTAEPHAADAGRAAAVRQAHFGRRTPTNTPCHTPTDVKQPLFEPRPTFDAPAPAMDLQAAPRPVSAAGPATESSGSVIDLTLPPSSTANSASKATMPTIPRLDLRSASAQSLKDQATAEQEAPPSARRRVHSALPSIKIPPTSAAAASAGSPPRAAGEKRKAVFCKVHAAARFAAGQAAKAQTPQQYLGNLKERVRTLKNQAIGKVDVALETLQQKIDTFEVPVTLEPQAAIASIQEKVTDFFASSEARELAQELRDFILEMQPK